MLTRIMSWEETKACVRILDNSPKTLPKNVSRWDIPTRSRKCIEQTTHCTSVATRKRTKNSTVKPTITTYRTTIRCRQPSMNAFVPPTNSASRSLKKLNSEWSMIFRTLCSRRTIWWTSWQTKARALRKLCSREWHTSMLLETKAHLTWSVLRPRASTLLADVKDLSNSATVRLGISTIVAQTQLVQQVPQAAHHSWSMILVRLSLKTFSKTR